MRGESQPPSQVTPALGLTWHHAVTTRVLLDAAAPIAGAEQRKRTARVAKSPAVPDVPFEYQVGPGGMLAPEPPSS